MLIGHGKQESENSENKVNENRQINFRLSLALLNEAKTYVDGIYYKSIGHILNMALKGWLTQKKREERAKKEGWNRDD